MLAGSILARAPYHWTGDQADLPTLMDDVFSVRMSGPMPTNSEHRSLGPFLDRVLGARADRHGERRRGRARQDGVRGSASVGCLGCHNGALMTTKAIVDVGTGGAFKVPSLIGVGARAPFLHDGCATTLADRFTATCGGGDSHGKTSQLTPAQVSDLVAYLETLYQLEPRKVVGDVAVRSVGSVITFWRFGQSSRRARTPRTSSVMLDHTRSPTRLASVGRRPSGGS